jgi:hypothetical protein
LISVIRARRRGHGEGKMIGLPNRRASATCRSGAASVAEEDGQVVEEGLVDLVLPVRARATVDAGYPA